MRDVIPLMTLLAEIGKTFKINEKKPIISCQIFEDNEIAIAKSTKLTPRTKHIAIKYHHFRHFVKTGKISIHSIDTIEQIADSFTKPLNEQMFKYLRKKLVGW